MIAITKELRPDISPASFVLAIEGETLYDYDGHDNQARVVVHVTADYWRLSGLYVPVSVRGMGFGTKLVQQAKREAQKARKPLFLSPEPYGVDPMEPWLLMRWYQELGFKRIEVGASPAPVLMRWIGGAA